jgi:hypothetical protein
LKVVRVLLAALDLVTVAGALEGIAPGSARGLVLVLVAVVGLVLVFVAALVVVALADQRRPPYPMAP